MFDRSLGAARLLPLWVLVVTLLGGCGSKGHPPTPTDGVGTLQMALTATANGHRYRLRQATFTVTGPTNVVLDTEAMPDAAALTAVLNAGDYTILLGGPYFIERLDPAGPVRVNATLLSANPQLFATTAGATVNVPFRFATDGTVVFIGTGMVSVTTEVTEVNPPGDLTLLAGHLGGQGSGDRVGPQARFTFPT